MRCVVDAHVRARVAARAIGLDSFRAMADDEDKENWASMAEAFDFGDEESKPSPPARVSSRLLPVPSLDAATSCAAAPESIDATARRFAAEFRAKSPCVTRRVAEPWMSSSRLGRECGDGVFGPRGPARHLPAVLLHASRDDATFLGRGDLCRRREGVPAEEAWARVRDGGADAERCYLRLPLGPELWADLDFRPAAALARGARNSNGVDDRSPGGGPPPPLSSRTASVWASSPGCVTPLHFDLCHGFLTQIRGRKRALLVPPEHTRSLHRNPPRDANPNSSRVDLPLWVDGEGTEAGEAERRRHPRVVNAIGEIFEAIISPGETLYIPPFWWHHVTTLDGEGGEGDEGEGGASVSALLAFDPEPDESVHPCVEDD